MGLGIVSVPLDGFAIGAGFSVVENIIYLTRFPELAPPTWMVRGLGTAKSEDGVDRDELERCAEGAGEGRRAQRSLDRAAGGFDQQPRTPNYCGWRRGPRRELPRGFCRAWPGRFRPGRRWPCPVRPPWP